MFDEFKGTIDYYHAPKSLIYCYENPLAFIHYSRQSIYLVNYIDTRTYCTCTLSDALLDRLEYLVLKVQGTHATRLTLFIKISQACFGWARCY